MILVTVGTHSQSFDRLIRAADGLAAILAEPVLIQLGCSRYLPRHAGSFQWADGRRMDELTAEARVVITHAAAGAILGALQALRPLVLVPRLRRFGEHFDDHQLQLATELDRRGRGVAVHTVTPEALREAVERAPGLLQAAPPPDTARLVRRLSDQLRSWEPAARRCGESLEEQA